MLVTTFYNLVDTLYIRQLANDSMVAAVGALTALDIRCSPFVVILRW